MLDYKKVSHVAVILRESRRTATEVVRAEGRPLLIEDPGRPTWIRVVGGDEYVSSRTEFGDKDVVVILHLIRHCTPLSAEIGSRRQPRQRAELQHILEQTLIRRARSRPATANNCRHPIPRCNHEQN